MFKEITSNHTSEKSTALDLLQTPFKYMPRRVVPSIIVIVTMITQVTELH